MGFDWVVSFMPYGSRFRQQRTFLHRYMQPSVLNGYTQLQTDEARRMLRGILANSHEYDKHVRR